MTIPGPTCIPRHHQKNMPPCSPCVCSVSNAYFSVMRIRSYNACEWFQHSSRQG
ncbi:hypothetical protein BC834DRAFT_876401 [Gloeopeniophorella convolvens]|nr:hypothetical protein BC834DRAFT_876401 [Gloeopeniophorella convolvens]